ncbi:MAG: hypothetical protein A2X32_06705 [Elusimicrobia bacterium GWC2_64_44]|nr:MAG: hypothetical protein A2X32_06705 [Elusimicrobia bacterium GWC2_64_44]
MEYTNPGPPDGEKIYKLLELLYEGHIDGGLRQVMTEYLADDNYFKIAAVDPATGAFAGFLLGSCRLEVDFECRAGIIEELVVLPEHRKKGIAKTLLEALEAWSRKKGAKGVLVPCGREGFYEAMGFEKYMVRRYWKDLKD